MQGEKNAVIAGSLGGIGFKTALEKGLLRGRAKAIGNSMGFGLR